MDEVADSEWPWIDCSKIEVLLLELGSVDVDVGADIQGFGSKKEIGN